MGNAHSDALFFCRLGLCCGRKDALSGVTALQLTLCAVSKLLAPRESTAPSTVPGAVHGTVGIAGSAGLGDVYS